MVGGPKKLPVVSNMVDDEDDPKGPKKPKIVIIGAGWGAVGVLKTLNKDDYHVTVSDSKRHVENPNLPNFTPGRIGLDFQSVYPPPPFRRCWNRLRPVSR
jgi:hypothetical protein